MNVSDTTSVGEIPARTSMKIEEVKSESTPSFGELVGAIITDVSNRQTRAAALMKKYDSGEADFDLSTVMVEAQKSRLQFQFGLKVRNHLLSAYREILNMPL
jgi:flagellar hook-basal body complex protein FliE